MVDTRLRRLLDAYPAIYLACHRRHVRDDETGAIVTAHQASVLDHLDAVRPTTLSRLAEHMGVGRSAMSLAVDRLVRGGYVVRRRSATSGRTVSLTLTPAGDRIKQQNTVLDPDLVAQMFTLMPASEVESALNGIETMARYARTLLRRRKRARDR